jgi:predicted DNA-binding protein (MmcQ/YjbR family)
MTLDQYDAFCGALPATTYVVQWGGSHVWKVGGKVFAIGRQVKTDASSGYPAFSFKVSEHNFQVLPEHSSYRPAPYLASRGMKWIQQFNAPSSEDGELEYYLTESHRIVSLGLSKKKQRELGLNQD